MLFVSAMRPEYIFHYKRLQEKKDDLLVKLLEERKTGRSAEPLHETRRQSKVLEKTVNTEEDAVPEFEEEQPYTKEE